MAARSLGAATIVWPFPMKSAEFYLAAFLSSAYLRFMASEIFFRAAALILRFFIGGAGPVAWFPRLTVVR